MHATEIVGWTNGTGCAFCTEHEPEDSDEKHPILAVEEGWEEMTCDVPHDGEHVTLGWVEGVS